MSVDVDSFLAQLEPPTRAPNGEGRSMLYAEDPKSQEAFAEYEKRVDALFGARHAHHVYQKERPQHRLMLWLRLQGFNNKEIANTMGVHPMTVSQVTRQPWFLEAFTRISTEMGKDAVENFLTGEVVPTLQKLVSLRDGATSEAVQLAASNAILDRIRGKPTVKVESKSESSVSIAVTDINKLEEQYQQNQKTLQALGVSGNN